MVRPIARKPFVVSRGFRLFRELFKFQDVEKLRDDRIYLAAVTGEIQGDAYTGQIGNVVVDFLECLVWFFTSGIAPLHFCAESGGILGARGHDRPDTGILQGELEFLCREPPGCVVECPFHLVCIDKLLY